MTIDDQKKLKPFIISLMVSENGLSNLNVFFEKSLVFNYDIESVLLHGRNNQDKIRTYTLKSIKNLSFKLSKNQSLHYPSVL